MQTLLQRPPVHRSGQGTGYHFPTRPGIPGGKSAPLALKMVPNLFRCAVVFADGQNTYNSLNQFALVWNQLRLAGATITKPIVHRRQVYEGSFSCAKDLLEQNDTY